MIFFTASVTTTIAAAVATSDHDANDIPTMNYDEFRTKLEKQWNVAFYVLIGCITFMVFIVIGCLMVVDCTHVAESANAFLTEYNSQYIHDDNDNDGAAGNKNDAAGNKNNTAQTENDDRTTTMQKKKNS